MIISPDAALYITASILIAAIMFMGWAMRANDQRLVIEEAERQAYIEDAERFPVDIDD